LNENLCADADAIRHAVTRLANRPFKDKTLLMTYRLKWPGFESKWSVSGAHVRSTIFGPTALVADKR